MDEQLRGKPDDVVTLLRAGRLSTERVAMAAYLGDERATNPRVGVEPWEAPTGWATDVAENPWAAFVTLVAGQFTHRERVWLACLVVQDMRSRYTCNEPRVAEVIRLTRGWCVGAVTEAEVWAIQSPCEVSDRDVAWAASSLQTTVIHCDPFEATENATPFELVLARGEMAARVASVAHSQTIAWQAQAIANVLLDPDWPPWDESEG